MKYKKTSFILLMLVSFCMTLNSCEEFINEINIENDSISLVAPFDGASIDNGTIQFDWLPLEGATSYRIQIARPDFQMPEQILWDEVVPDSLGTNTGVDLNTGTYQWRVRGENSAYLSPYTTYNLVIN